MESSHGAPARVVRRETDELIRLSPRGRKSRRIAPRALELPASGNHLPGRGSRSPVDDTELPSKPGRYRERSEDDQKREDEKEARRRPDDCHRLWQDRRPHQRENQDRKEKGADHQGGRRILAWPNFTTTPGNGRDGGEGHAETGPDDAARASEGRCHPAKRTPVAKEALMNPARTASHGRQPAELIKRRARASDVPTVV